MSPALQLYFQLLQNYPHLASNDDAPIRIITDLKRIQQFEEKTGQQIGVIANDEYVSVVHDLVENEAGKTFVHLRILARKHFGAKQGTVILPIERRPEGDFVIMIRIFRHALRAWSLEIPRGFGESHLSDVENAKKELREETGLTPTSLELLGIIEPDSGLMDNRACVFAATVSTRESGKAQPEAMEAIKQIESLSLLELREAINRGAIRDSYTLGAITLARAKRILCF